MKIVGKLHKEQQPNILVIGSFMMDLVVCTPRMPEVGETVIGTDFQRFPGGKGANQAVAASKLGARVTMAGRVGTDPFGEDMLSTLAAHSVDVKYVLRDDSAPTGVGSVTIDRAGNNRIVVVPGANMEYGIKDLRQIEHLILDADVILLQLEIPLETVACAVEIASQHQVPVILNPAPARELDERILQGVSYLTPNETEAAILSGVKITDLVSAKSAALKLVDMGVANVVITLGAHGAVYTDGVVTGHVPAFNVDVVDTVAAGDAFNAGLAVALTQGKSLAEAVRFANAVGALAVTRHGAIPSLPSLIEVTDLLGKSESA